MSLTKKSSKPHDSSRISKHTLRSGMPTLLLSIFILLASHTVSAYYLINDADVTPDYKRIPHSYLIAQSSTGSTSPDDAYDPFADYSEFDEATDEEADIFFFKNGRFLTTGLILGARSFTGSMAKYYTSGFTYGVAFAYFFDMRTALQFGFSLSDHLFGLKFFDSQSGNTEVVTGKVSFSFLSLDLKYYFNTQNVTKGLADLNPYVIGGFSQTFRSYKVDGNASNEARLGANVGAGIEIPLGRNKNFVGLQGIYHIVTFDDENTNFVFNDTGTPSNIKINGDPFDILVIVGFNY